jgi:outer membrane phospholipase A
MRLPNLVILTILFVSIFYFISDSAESSGNDSTLFNPDTLKKRYPDLWSRTSASIEASLADLPALDVTKRDSLIAASIKSQTGGNPGRAQEIETRIKWEDEYIENKSELDISRGKFVINPYLTNYVYWGYISDPNPDMTPRSRRGALKWQISVQMPIVTTKYSNTGFFLAFTNRGTFDILNKEYSRPVTNKTFMPEVFGRFDLAIYNKKLGVDQLVLQAGAQHESNGGIDDSTSLLDSRGIFAKYYGQVCWKLFKTPSDNNRRNLPNDRYALMLSARGFYCDGIEDNNDIVKYIGYLDLNGSFELTSFLKARKIERTFGVFMLDGFYSPGGSLDAYYGSFALGLSWTPPMFSTKNKNYSRLPKVPLTFYGRVFRGYNEYLITYNKLTTMCGFGVKLRS